MIGIAIDALVLMFLLKVVSDGELEFGTAIIVALVTSIGTMALAFGLTAVLGIAGFFLAALIGAGALGIAVSAMFGVEIKRSFLVGVVFMLVHLGSGLGLRWMMST